MKQQLSEHYIHVVDMYVYVYNVTKTTNFDSTNPSSWHLFFLFHIFFFLGRMNKRMEHNNFSYIQFFFFYSNQQQITSTRNIIFSSLCMVDDVVYMEFRYVWCTILRFTECKWLCIFMISILYVF